MSNAAYLCPPNLNEFFSLLAFWFLISFDHANTWCRSLESQFSFHTQANSKEISHFYDLAEKAKSLWKSYFFLLFGCHAKAWKICKGQSLFWHALWSLCALNRQFSAWYEKTSGTDLPMSRNVTRNFFFFKFSTVVINSISHEMILCGFSSFSPREKYGRKSTTSKA